MEQRAARKQGLRRIGADAPESGAGLEQIAHRRGGTADVAGNGQLRQQIGDRDADLRRGGMQLRLGRSNVGTPFDQLRRDTQRQIGGQHQLVELELARLEVGGQASGQRGKRIAHLLQLTIQRRQGGFQLRQRGVLSEHVPFGDGAELQFAAQHRERFALECDDAARCPRFGPAGRLPGLPSLPHWP